MCALCVSLCDVSARVGETKEREGASGYLVFFSFLDGMATEQMKNVHLKHNNALLGRATPGSSSLYFLLFIVELDMGQYPTHLLFLRCTHLGFGAVRTYLVGCLPVREF